MTPHMAPFRDFQDNRKWAGLGAHEKREPQICCLANIPTKFGANL